MSDEVECLLTDLFSAGMDLSGLAHRYPLTEKEVTELIQNVRAIHANLGVLIDEFEYKWKGQKHE